MTGKRKQWNQLFYGIMHKRTHRRSGGLYYMSEEALGGHNYKSEIAFAILEDCAKSGDDIKQRPKEREFLLRSGKELCDFLKLDYSSVWKGIEKIWENNNEI